MGWGCEARKTPPPSLSTQIFSSHDPQFQVNLLLRNPTLNLFAQKSSKVSQKMLYLDCDCVSEPQTMQYLLQCCAQCRSKHAQLQSVKK